MKLFNNIRITFYSIIIVTILEEAICVLPTNETKFSKCSKYENSQCSTNEVCIYGECECRPNYRLESNECKYFKCKNDSECMTYDKKRKCNSNGVCVCKRFAGEDDFNKRCESVCSLKTSCDPNQVCIDNSCECAPNYQWSKNNVKCIPYKCHSDSDCWYSGDFNRECRANSCVCTKYYKEENWTKRCKYPYNDLVYVCLLVFIPAIIIICGVFYFRNKRRQRLAERSSDPTTCQYAHHQTYPPPPPYSP